MGSLLGGRGSRGFEALRRGEIGEGRVRGCTFSLRVSSSIGHTQKCFKARQRRASSFKMGCTGRRNGEGARTSSGTFLLNVGKTTMLLPEDSGKKKVVKTEGKPIRRHFGGEGNVLCLLKLPKTTLVE